MISVFGFAWGTDDIERIGTESVHADAGVGKDSLEGFLLFLVFVTNWPFHDFLLWVIWLYKFCRKNKYLSLNYRKVL